MHRTPSPPPRRLRTPPAPLHGAKHDDFEPYSPRRSTRLHPQSERQVPSSPTRSRIARAPREETPRSKKAVPSSQLSPPASPTSPHKLASPRSSRRARPALDSEDSDTPFHAPGSAAPTPARRQLFANMLPTPAKTPRKRVLESETTFSSTARVLFTNRPATIEDAMPTPRKSRKTARTLFALDEEDEADGGIQIHVDTKERIPSADEDEDNPFLTKRGRAKPRAAPKPSVKAEMQQRADRGEGIVYMFRGKKVFRPFTDRESQASSEHHHSDEEVRHQAGSTAHRPITRSHYQPRKLFQDELKKRNGPLDTDEEAETEIEQSVPITASFASTSSRKSHKTAETDAPVGSQEHLRTPPSTVRKTRQTSLDSWTRVKSASSSSRPKRGAETLESAAPKRSRSEQSSTMPSG